MTAGFRRAPTMNSIARHYKTGGHRPPLQWDRTLSTNFMASLSTHVLDIVHGRPAEGVVIELHEVTGASARLLKTTKTNADGRTDDSVSTIDLHPGVYELRFLAGDY